MAMASLSASLLARKGSAQPVGAKQAEPHNRIQFIPQDIPQLPQERQRTNDPKNMIKENGQRSFGKSKTGKISVSNVKNSKRKSVRLSPAIDKDLRLLAAGMGVSQQSIMEEAINNHIARTFNDRGCICRPSREKLS